MYVRLNDIRIELGWFLSLNPLGQLTGCGEVGDHAIRGSTLSRRIKVTVQQWEKVFRRGHY